MADLPRRAVAVVIGIGEYQHADRLGNLASAEADAHSIADLLMDPVCGFPKDQVVVLTNKHAHRDRVVQQLSHWLPQQARQAELAVIFFAGHGIVRKTGGREEGYLVPYDGDPDDIVTHGVAMSDIAAWISDLQVGAVIVFLDCCHSGKVIFRDGVTLRGGIPAAGLGPEALHGLAGRRRFLISSCDEGQKSIEVDSLNHGLFTYHLLKGIAGAGDGDADGKVEIAELFNYVTDAVSRDAREKYGREQKPWTSATWTERVFISYPRDGAVPPSEVPVSTFSPAVDRTFIVSDIEQNLSEAKDTFLINALHYFQRTLDPQSIPILYHCLAHRSEAVRQKAKKAVGAFGWENTASHILELVKHASEERISYVLEGLAAYEAHANVVQLLDRLVLQLRGSLRDRATLLLERKQLGLGLNQVADLFQKINSPYRIKKVVGAGPFTAAYLADVEGTTDLEVVIRVLRRELTLVVSIRNQFCELNSKLLPLVHHNLVHTRESRAFPEHGIYYTVRDFIAGPTLREVLESGKQFDLTQVLSILSQVTEALIPLHQKGLVHGGVKPSNIFILERAILGDPSLPLPFPGVDPKRVTYDLRYSAPELALGSSSATPRSDFYSLGCVAHELVCGQPPFIADTNHDLVGMHLRDAIPTIQHRAPALSLNGDRFLKRLMAKSPDDRFITIEEVLEAIRGLQEMIRRPPSGPSSPQKPTQPTPPEKPGPITTPAAQAGATPAPGELSLVRSQKSPSGSEPSEVSRLLGMDSLAKFRPRDSLVTMASEVKSLAKLESVVSGSAGWPHLPGYEIVAVLGRGGMGVVYLAHDLRLRRKVAVKMMAERYYRDDLLRRFQNEARAVATLSHPNIVQVFEVGEWQGNPYISLEFVEGGSLADLVRSGPLAPREAASIIAKVADAVHHAHERGILHRDLKPNNVLITSDGEPKIADFGIAKNILDDNEQTNTGVILGTPMYMAPEQISGNASQIGTPIDIYSLGAMLYVVLTGRPPFEAGSLLEMLRQVTTSEPRPLRQLNPGVSPDLETICLKCLSKRAEQRYESAAELAQDLKRFLHAEPIRARPSTLIRRIWLWMKRNPIPATLLTVIYILICAVIGLAMSIAYLPRR